MILEPALATVVLGLVAAVGFGASDFGGGLLSRRAPVLGVVLVSQSVAGAMALFLTVLAGEAVPGSEDLLWCLIAGLFGGIGTTALYRGLAVGTMGLIAPLTAVLASTIPVIAGIVLQGSPPLLVSIGIGVALVAVVLVSWETGDGSSRAGLGPALIAGSAFGVFEVAIAQVSSESVLGPVTAICLTQAFLVAVVIAATRSPWRPSRSQLPPLAAIGGILILGDVAFLLAVQTGALAVASVLSSLYPVVTIVLAAVILRERIDRLHATGIVVAMIAIALIGAGSS